jgi:phage terminase Nu1 subunit (DNA packaging protein)
MRRIAYSAARRRLDLSTRRVQDLDQSRVSYIRYLRGNASGQHTGAGLKLTDERARLAKLQADKVEIELAELRGEVVRADDVAKVMQAHIMGAGGGYFLCPLSSSRCSRQTRARG